MVIDTDVLAKRVINTATVTDDLAGEASDSITINYYKEIVTHFSSPPSTAKSPVKSTTPTNETNETDEEVKALPEDETVSPKEEYEILERVVLDDGRIMFVPKIDVIFVSIPTQAIQGETVIQGDGTAIYTPHTISRWDGFELEFEFNDETEIIWIEIADEETALGAVLPQTGEHSLLFNSLFGALMLILGLFLIFRKKKTEILS
jgi:LPXTG-motif cell wall-anchored protein